MLPLQALLLPVMLTGVLGTALTTNVRAGLLPQLFMATTVRVHVVKFDGKLMLTALKLFGPLTLAPLLTVHRYAVACATGVIEYVTSLAPHCPIIGPEIAPGVLGTPLAMPLHRCGLELPHALTAVTQTCEPEGMDAGKRMLHEVPLGETTAPATVVVQV